MEIFLPRTVFDRQLTEYIESLLPGYSESEILLDFGGIRHFIPGAVVGTLAIVRSWVDQHKKVYFRGHDTNENCGYLQRIDFFKRVGFNLPEPGTRRNPSGRFIPIEEISTSYQNVDKIASQMAECICPGGFIENPPYQFAQYACGEIVNNCKQHSKGIGFASAQYSAIRDFARIAVADFGRGILGSFKENRSAHYSEGMNDLEAIGKALQPRVSSTTHLPHVYGSSPNKGVGLSMVRSLMQQSLGYLIVISGHAWLFQDGVKRPVTGYFHNDCAYPGTLCAVTFKRGEVQNFVHMIRQAQKELDLLGNVNTDNLFL